MWTKSKSATLTLICTRIVIGIAIALAVLLPFLFPNFSETTSRAEASHLIASGILPYIFVGLPKITVVLVYICAYAAFVPALIALLSLDSLLRNIRKDSVFISDNVKYLRIISWCCFIIAIVMLFGWPHIHVVLIFVAAAAAFFGILMRVVKNVIDAACELKAENDYTI